MTRVAIVTASDSGIGKTTALMLALTIRLYERYGSLDLDEILTRAKEEEKA